jgi:hypothetical protein
MKKLTFCMMTAFVLLSFSPIQLKAEINGSTAGVSNTNSTEAAKTGVSTDVNAKNVSEAAEVAESNANIARLEEIRAMDMSELTPAEKKELREEVHAIQNEQDVYVHDHDRYDNDGPRHHHRGSVVFVGGGGILLIILILLLL